MEAAHRLTATQILRLIAGESSDNLAEKAQAIAEGEGNADIAERIRQAKAAGFWTWVPDSDPAAAAAGCRVVSLTGKGEALAA